MSALRKRDADWFGPAICHNSGEQDHVPVHTRETVTSALRRATWSDVAAVLGFGVAAYGLMLLGAVL